MARVLLRDDNDQPIAVECLGCKRLTVNTITATCARCTNYNPTTPETTMRKRDKDGNPLPRECKHTKKYVTDNGLTIDARGEFVYVVAGEVSRSAPDSATTSVPESTPTPGPMLASAMTERVAGPTFDRQFASGWCMEEKLDGHRCLVLVADGTVAAFSRPRAGGNGALRRELPAPIIEQLCTFPNGVYDGELCVPGGNSWNVVELGASLVLVLFDVLNIDGTDITRWRYEDRREALLRVLDKMPPSQQAVSTVESVPPKWSDVEAIWQRGGEGVILKRLDSPYRPDYRSADWLKVKQVNAATLTLTGFEAGKNGPYSVMLLRDAFGIDTKCKTLTQVMLAEIAASPASFIGRQVVISYQMKTPSGTYRHGVFDHWAGEAERIGATAAEVTVWACKACGRLGKAEHCTCGASRGQMAESAARRLFMETHEPPTGWADADDLDRTWRALDEQPKTDRSAAARKAAETRRARRAVA